jgi:hypothetical protein
MRMMCSFENEKAVCGRLERELDQTQTAVYQRQ